MNLNDIGEPFAVGNTAKVYLYELTLCTGIKEGSS